MNIVTLPKLRELRYPHQKLAKLQRLAREGNVPGAFKLTPTSDWQVDLDAHDAAIAAAKVEATAPATHDQRLFRMVLDRMRERMQ